MNVGVLGAGQLGRMLAQAGRGLGMRFRFLAPPGETCVEGLGELMQGDLQDPALIERFARGLDVVTFEWENVPAAVLERV
ncbi:MAG: 5-(carboxyamino)imidazole ribonucleotide synthase, partial [Planctomycetia bacterium]|nr:5-(carboxyamino)imidazole ribonucleotide synthase [Planctomycetia bacterium]